MGEPRSATRFHGLDTVALIELVRTGDHDAYGELYLRYHDFAHKIARRSSRRHADDLVAESFRRVLTAITRGAGPTQAFGPYLATTIRSAAAGLAAPYQEVELEVNNLLTDEHGDVDPKVSTAYLSLPEPWQNALWYSDVEGMSPRQAAPLLGLASANAFSALRKRAKAGLRSAYLTQVVDEACNEHVRRYLEMLMAGTVTAAAVDDAVDEHLRDCDECAAIAWRVAAVTGNRVGLVLAPALLAFHGFASSSALLPAGLGLPALLGWLRGIPKSVAAAGTTAAVAGMAVVAVTVGSILGGPGGGPTTVREALPSAPAAADDVEGDGAASGPGGSSEPARTPAVPVAAGATTDQPTTTESAVTDSTTTEPTTVVSTSVPPTPVGTIATLSPGVTSTAPGPVVTATTGPRTVGTTATTLASTIRPGTSTVPAVVTTSPATTGPPKATTISTTSTTTTSTTSTTTTSTTTTSTTTTTTTVPPVAPAQLQVTFDRTIGSGADALRWIRLEVVARTGAGGSITFSKPIDDVVGTRVTCSSSSCSLGGTTQPGFVLFRTSLGPLTITLRDAAGTPVQVVTLP